MSAQRHKWEDPGPNWELAFRPEGVGCTREGCQCRHRFRYTARWAGGHSKSLREEYSADNGQSWGTLAAGFSGRVPECKGGRA